MDAHRLSPHFTVAEFERSQVASRLGIPNAMPPGVRNNAERLCLQLLEPIRTLVGVPMMVSSGYRGVELNGAIGGARSSQHTQGLAADLVVPGWTALELCWLIFRHARGFDQLIFEGTWTHVSIAATGAAPRRNVLTAHFATGRPVRYSPGLPPLPADARQ